MVELSSSSNGKGKRNVDEMGMDDYFQSDDSGESEDLNRVYDYIETSDKEWTTTNG